MGFASETYSPLSFPIRRNRKLVRLGGPIGRILLIALRPKGETLVIGRNSIDLNATKARSIATLRRRGSFLSITFSPYGLAMRKNLKTRYAEIYLLDASVRSTTPAGPFHLTPVEFRVGRSLRTGAYLVRPAIT